MTTTPHRPAPSREPFAWVPPAVPPLACAATAGLLRDRRRRAA
ncbi:hypothetical protein [Roseicella aerolata]|nr:hypothetical protein [Roseicella aerolata]